MGKPLKPTLRHILEYAALRSVVFLLGLLPLRAALVFGAALGRLAWMLGTRRRVSLANIRQAFPGIGDREARRIGSRSYASAGRFMVEFARQDRLGVRHLEKFVTVRTPEVLEEFARTGGIGVGFHFGNWELLGMIVRKAGADVSLLVGKQHNSLVDGFINRLRSSHGIGLITRDGAMRGIFRTVKSGGAVCWLSDQDAGRNGVIVDFFGFPASTPRGAAAIAVRTGCPVYPMFLIREKGPRQTAVMFEPILPRTDLPAEEAERILTQEYTLRLEEMVRAYPDHYWWAHRRWKTTGLYSSVRR
ncbi:hypothetical protein GX411_02625 [Candidatus Fermentibacteria bacterium]|nr:hypothetical protein [Candidatus Fermentibacteria bacterium]